VAPPRSSASAIQTSHDAHSPKATSTSVASRLKGSERDLPACAAELAAMPISAPKISVARKEK
jgi:hypothetical protein